jgi:hypothetical protein
LREWRYCSALPAALKYPSPRKQNSRIVEQLAHYRYTKVAFTLDRYGHVLPGMQEKASAKLESILFGR